MKFMVISKPRHLAPPEMIIPLLDGFLAWLDKYTENGQLEDSWNFAGTQGGGGIVNVDSHEELDAIMAEYPFGPFSEIEIYPLSDLRESLQRGKARIAHAAPKPENDIGEGVGNRRVDCTPTLLEGFHGCTHGQRARRRSHETVSSVTRGTPGAVLPIQLGEMAKLTLRPVDR